ncbi:MAG: PAS domain S-box protein, partial [Arcobacteraceae bacterium]|nr:PAS domain S-box protein [Arcobacteraceae bacterium]
MQKFLLLIYLFLIPLFPSVLAGSDSEQLSTQLPQIIIFSIFLGVFLSLFINSHFLYITTKESDYLFYSGFILFFSIWMIANYGYLEYIFESLIVINILTIFSFYVGALSLMLFTLRFLNIEKIYPNFFNISSLFISIGILFFIAISLDLKSEFFGEMLLLSFICFYLGIVSCRNKYAPSKYYLLGIGGYLFGLSIEILVMKGVVPSTFYTTEAHLIGFIWEMIFLLLALGYKIRLLQNERNDAISKTQIQEKMLFLQSRQASVGELVGNIAHQWREPLGAIGAIYTNLEATLMLKGSIPNEKLINSLGESYKIIRHLSDTIDIFYRFFKHKKSDKKEFDISNAIRNIQQMVHYTLSVENITLVYESKEEIMVFGNRSEFANAILNIILNARDVLIERKIQNPLIRIEMKQSNNEIIITIEDNGTGIKQKPIDAIFKSGVSSKEQSIGIGLFIAKTIIEQRLGGNISVENSVHGALFTISLPLKLKRFQVTHPLASYDMEEDTLKRISRLEKEVVKQGEIEKALQQWEDIFHQTHWGVAVHRGTNDTFDMVNPAFCQMYGYSADELKNMTAPELFAPEYLKSLQLKQQEAFSKCFTSFESVHIRKDGSRFPVNIDLTVIKNEYDEILYHIANVRDITEQKGIAIALKTSEEAFRAMVENSPDVIMRYDRECRRTYINPLGLLLMGKPKEELLGKTPRDFSPLPDISEFEEAFYRVVNEAIEVKIEGEFNTSKGEKRWGEERIVPELNREGEVVSVLVIGRDMTELRKAELEIKEREEKFSKLFMSSPAAVSVTSIDRNMYLEVNESFLSFAKYTREEVIGKSSADLQLFANTEERAEFFRMVLEDGCVRGFEFEYQAKDGTTGYGIAYATLLYINGEKCVLAHSYDINAKKQLELVSIALNSTSEAVYITDETFSIMYVNDGACKMLGYTREELTSMKVYEIDALYSLENLSTLQEDKQSIQEIVFETKHKMKNGTIIDVEIVGSSFSFHNK